MATFLFVVTLAIVLVNQALTDDVPAVCQHSTFCEVEPRDHPREVIDKYIEENRALFENSLPDVNEIARQGTVGDGHDLCSSTKKVIYPLQARGVDNRWYTLVNRQNKPAQGFQVEICGQTSECSSMIFFATGYSGRCVQKYIQRLVPVMNRGSDGEWSVRQQVVKFPSCCACIGAQNIKFIE